MYLLFAVLKKKLDFSFEFASFLNEDSLKIIYLLIT